MLVNPFFFLFPKYRSVLFVVIICFASNIFKNILIQRQNSASGKEKMITLWVLIFVPLCCKHKFSKIFIRIDKKRRSLKLLKPHFNMFLFNKPHKLWINHMNLVFLSCSDWCWSTVFGFAVAWIQMWNFWFKSSEEDYFVSVYILFCDFSLTLNIYPLPVMSVQFIILTVNNGTKCCVWK